MKKITIILTFLLGTATYAQKCDYKEVMESMTMFYDKVERSSYDVSKFDFAPILLDNRTDYLGCIGVNKKRLVIDFQSIKKDAKIRYAIRLKAKQELVKTSESLKELSP